MWVELNVYHPLTNDVDMLPKQKDGFKVAKFFQV